MKANEPVTMPVAIAPIYSLFKLVMYIHLPSNPYTLVGYYLNLLFLYNKISGGVGRIRTYAHSVPNREC